jgi:hypothetical protein
LGNREKGTVMGDAEKRALEEAWAEYQSRTEQNGVHVGALEAMQLLREAAGGKLQPRNQERLSPQKEEQGRFLDWLLHTRQDKALAYELLRQTGTLTVGSRQYWATTQGQRRAIAWESRYTYPDSDSEIWDLILVDQA